MSDTADDFAAVREHTKQKHAAWRQQNLAALIKAGVNYATTNNGETLLFRQPGKPKVDFYPSTGRWRVAGMKQTFSGGAEKFLTWYEKQKA